LVGATVLLGLLAHRGGKAGAQHVPARIRGDLMPLFRFHLHAPNGVEFDDTGLEFQDLETAYLEACHTIPEIAADLVREGLSPMLHAFEIVDAAGQVLMEVPFGERLKDGQRPRRPRRPRCPRSRTAPRARRLASRAAYHLRCSYRFTDDRQGLAVSTREVKASSTDAAIEAAEQICLDRPDMRLASAFLIEPGGLIVWSKHVAVEPVRWAEATRGVPRFAQV
jgi:hypothetical protein